MVRIKTSDFITSAVRRNQYPEGDLPEVAFMGRSNVGKSTLINAITGRRKLAKVSGTPGRTRLVNFFLLNGRCMLVDLPGYGYAKVSKSEQKSWSGFIEEYLATRENLAKFVLLVDARHTPTKDDRLMMDYLRHYRKDVIVVATKLDKLKRNDIRKSEKIIRETLALQPEEPLILYSATSKENLQGVIDTVFGEILAEDA